MLRSVSARVFLALALVYLAAGAWTTRRVSATGDEVTYFMAADSLGRGEGLELTARWRALDGATYSPGDPVPEDELLRTTAPSASRPGRFPIHDLGLPLAIALPLAIGGRALVVALMALAMAAAVAIGHRAALVRGVSARAALLGALATGLAVPALTYSGQVFADTLAPGAVAAAVLGLRAGGPRWLVPVALAALPLLHVRYWPIALGLGLAAVALARPRPREAIRLALPTAGVAIGLAAAGLAVYGLPLPHAGFLLFFATPHAPIETYGGAGGIAGLFVDRAFGLLPAAPLAVLLFAGVARAMRDRTDRAIALALLPYLVLVPLVDWTGGFSPQARYFAPLVGAFPLLYARALEVPAARLLAVPLALWTAAQSAIYVVAPWLRYDAYGVPPLADRAWERFVPVTPSALFPQLGGGGPVLALAAAWCLALALVAAAGARESRQNSV